MKKRAKRYICICLAIITTVVLLVSIYNVMNKKNIDIDVKFGKKAIEVFNKEKNFEEILKKLNNENLVYVKNGDEISIMFNREKPRKIAVTEYILTDEGKYKYGKEKIGEDVNVEWDNSKAVFKVKPNVSTMLSSNGEDYNPKGVIKGYRLVIDYAEKSEDYCFVIKGDAAIINK